MPDRAPPLEPNDDAAQSRYAVASRVEILFLLNDLQAHDALVDLAVGGASIITSVLAVNEVSNTLLLDAARDDALNRSLTRGEAGKASATLDGVRIHFATGALSLCEFDGRPALRTAIPGSVVRLQRREFFRISLPIARPVVCTIPADADCGRRALTTHVLDMGCGGVALVENADAPSLDVGARLAQCRIALPEIGTVTVTLEVRNVARIPLRSGASRMRYGCRFVDLPAHMSNLLQRYIMKLERERRTR
jgi:c-di-GMP-binding flagellar brake protein YcgR